jgi:hypothetical protein
MRSLLILLALAAPAAPQTAIEQFRKAPPAVDQALRDRVTQFYQLHMEKKWRKVSDLVDEESQDAFIAQIKRNPLSFQINEVQYSDNYTRAKVMTLIEEERLIATGGITRMKLPVQTEWRIVEGQWFNTIAMAACRPTPFGACNPEDATRKNEGGVDLKKQVEAAMNQAAAGQFPGMDQIGFGDETTVRIDPKQLALAAQTAEFTFQNPMDGWLSLTLVKISAKEAIVAFADEMVPPQGKAKVRVTLPKGFVAADGGVTLRVGVKPLNRGFDLRVSTIGR